MLDHSTVGAMLSFLKMCKPLDDPEKWRQYVSKASDEKRAKLLRVSTHRFFREGETASLTHYVSRAQAIVLSTTLRR